MSAATLPIGWVPYGGDGKDTVTFRRPNHTQDRPDLVILKRSTLPSSSKVTSKYQVKSVRGVDATLHAGTVGEHPNTIIETSIRNVDGQSLADITAVLADHAALLADAGFATDALSTLDLP